jgi:hypothetical protein
LLAQIAREQVAQPHVVVDDEDAGRAVLFGHACAIARSRECVRASSNRASDRPRRGAL